MTDQDLYDALHTLREELEQTGGLDTTTRHRLERLVDAIELEMEKSCQTDHHQSLVNLISGEVAYFEVSHPKLTTALNEIMTMLSAGGL